MKVREFQRAHRVVRAKPHGFVDGFNRTDALVQRVDGFVDHGQQNAIDDEGRKIFRDGRFLTQTFDKGFGGGKRFVFGRDPANELHQFHQRNRVHEVHTDESLQADQSRRRDA